MSLKQAWTGDKPDGKSYYAFGGLHYKSGRTLDGIERTPGALTAESTYRVVIGAPEIYITCLYRWAEKPAAKYISDRSIEFGKRMGRNKLLLPAPGCEELFWQDAKALITSVPGVGSDSFVLNDSGVYLLITGLHPQLLPDKQPPFLLCDVSNLSSLELTSFFAKLLDLFNSEMGFFGSNDRYRDSPGKLLLQKGKLPSDDSRGPMSALRTLAEVCLVIQDLRISFHSFEWPVDDSFRQITAELQNSELRRTALEAIRQQLRSAATVEPSPPSVMKEAGVRTDSVEELVPRGARKPVPIRDVFLCHRSSDKSVVRKLAEALRAAGVSVWFDEAELSWGDSLVSKLAEGVALSRYVIVCVGTSFKSGNFAKYELELAMNDEVRFGKNKVLPLLLTSTEAETELLLAQVPTLRAKTYKSLSEGIEQIIQETVRLCAKTDTH